MAKKMRRRMVALSSSAIAAIYLTGYATTRSADAGLAGSQTLTGASSTVLTAPAPATVSGAAPRGAPAALPQSPPASSGSPAAAVSAAAYRDGTYQGSGMSRRGGVAVSVTIQDGRITATTITGGSTQYPLSRIASLPAQVVARQSAQVDRVTGATYSSQAFQQAVQQALAQAQVASGAAAAANGSVQTPPQAPSAQGVPGQTVPVLPGQPGQQGRPSQPGQFVRPGQIAPAPSFRRGPGQEREQEREFDRGRDRIRF
jgi:uncharacterized protein with FMN-binding domain